MTSKANQSQGMLLFHLSARQSFAIGTLKVKEIVPYTQLTALPHSHPTVLGAASWRLPSGLACSICPALPNMMCADQTLRLSSTVSAPTACLRN